MVALVPLLAGCMAAAGAAAGAAGAIAYSERGASTNLDASVGEVAQAAEEVFAELGITTTERDMEDGGEEIQLTGETTDGEMRVNVEIEAEDSGLTNVHVTAQEGTLDYDRDYAEDVLRRIVSRT